MKQNVQGRQDLSATEAAASPLVLDAQGLAAAGFGSVRHVRRLDASGRLPRAVRLGRKKVWLRHELKDWLSAGAPKRDEWEQSRENH